MKPLVSILISAYNAQEWVADALESAVAQTWPRKEIILVDDGSTDSTAAVAGRFASRGVTVISTKNGGLSAGQNHAYAHSHGDYLQFLDADDLLAPDKIERQVAALQSTDSRRILLSSPWAPFFYRTRHAQFVNTSLCQDLSPVEWTLRKMGENLHMQNATWLVGRELAEGAGPWRKDLHYDQDGEYFARVILASEGTRFVPGTGIFYRSTGKGSISQIGNSDKKKESLLLSLKLQIQYLRSIEDSERVRRACLTFLQNWYYNIYPERPDLVSEWRALAAQLQGELEEPRLRWKYDWMKSVFGWKTAKWAQMNLPHIKHSCNRRRDKVLYKLERRGTQRAG